MRQMITPQLALHNIDGLARTLAQRGVDPNEVAKSFTHLRSFIERAGTDTAARERAVEEWWRWLETLTGAGSRSVVRSNRTRDYHVAILNACRTHLQSLDTPDILPTLGWAVRLVRYYQTVPGALDQSSPFGEPLTPPRRERPRAETTVPPTTPTPPPKALPTVGAIFTGKVAEVMDAGVIVEVPGFALEQALGRIRAAALGDRRYAKGNSARVEVVSVREVNDRAILDLKPAPKPKS